MSRAFTREMDLEYARIHIGNDRAFFFFGFNNSFPTGSYADVWAGEGNINWQTTAAKVKVASTNTADKGTPTVGLGVHSVEIHGLDVNGNDQEEVVTLDGIAGSGNETESSLTYIRVNKMHSEACGTYGGSHEGNIECRVTNATFASGQLLSKMTGEEGDPDLIVGYGSGESGNGFWSVPLGKVMYITRLQVIPNFGASNKTIDMALYEREDILDVTTPFAPRRVIWQETGVETVTQHEFKSHIKIKPLTDVWFRGTASATSKVEVTLDFYLVDADLNGA